MVSTQWTGSRPALWLRTAAIIGVFYLGTAGDDLARGETHYYAAQCSVASAMSWGLLDRDGANRPTEPYLSSLVGGEAQTGSIGSPPFVIDEETIRFTIRGHDGREGGREENFIALLDNKTGTVLRRTFAPGNDALQDQAWDVAELKGRTVRIQITDGNSQGAFAWLGIGKIEAGSGMTIDFRVGMPKQWDSIDRIPGQETRQTTTVEAGPVPFRTYEDTYTWIPENGVGEVRIECNVRRLFVLGCTVPARRILETYGLIDVVYADGQKQSFPLTFGFTLESPYKTPGDLADSYILPVGDATQYLLVIRPADKVIDRIELRRAADDLPRPRVSAITCETAEPVSDQGTPLVAIPSVTATPGPLQWIEDHLLSAEGPKWQDLATGIRLKRGFPVNLSRIQGREDTPSVRFERSKVSDQSFEAASVCDIDNDGHKDIVSGNFWYAGPDFGKHTKFRSLEPVSGYHDSFADYPMDVNGDGNVDIVSGGWFGAALLWCENPGGHRPMGDWKVHEIDKTGPVETVRFWDVDGDGHVEVVPNAGGNVVFYRLARDGRGEGTGRFEKYVVQTGGCGHGIGFGDVDGDGQGDFVIPSGWFEAPKNPLAGKWTFRAEFQLGTSSVPILVHDVNEDGKADLIYGNAHGYGLFWLEQTTDADGKRTWSRRAIDDQSSQYHDMMLVDMDRDKRLELITGKRYRAHNGHDPGSEDPVFVRFFEIERKGDFIPHTLDFGPAELASGVGIYFWAEDVTGDGRMDIVAPGKEGLYLFKQE
ncbi:MAG: FG-GAP repeat domain-containing protein [Pirellulaceae bacterium]